MCRFLAQQASPGALSPCTSQSASCREQVKLEDESKGDQKTSQEVRATTQDRGDSDWDPGERRGGGEGRATARRGVELDEGGTEELGRTPGFWAELDRWGPSLSWEQSHRVPHRPPRKCTQSTHTRSYQSPLPLGARPYTAKPDAHTQRLRGALH